MKKVLILLFAALLVPTQSDAQFLKKLLKTATEIGKQVLENAATSSSSTSSSSSSSSSSTTATLKTSTFATTSGATVKTTLPNIQVDVIGAYHNGEGVLIDMTITNNGSETQSFVFTGVKLKLLSTTPADAATFKQSNWKLADHDWYHYGQEFNGSCWDYQIASGGKIAAQCLLKGMPSSVTSLDNVVMSVRLGGTVYYVGEDEKIYQVTVTNLPVRQQTATSSVSASAQYTDRKAFNLNGAVKSVACEDSDDGLGYVDEGPVPYSTITFTRAGEVATLDDMPLQAEGDGMEYSKRDAKGRLSTFVECGMPGEAVSSYTYDEQGRIAKCKESFTYYDTGKTEDNGTTSYTYDADGNLAKMGDTVYTILKKDSHGNWTTRRQANSSTGESSVTTRVITYW